MFYEPISIGMTAQSEINYYIIFFFFREQPSTSRRSPVFARTFPAGARTHAKHVARARGVCVLHAMRLRPVGPRPGSNANAAAESRRWTG